MDGQGDAYIPNKKHAGVLKWEKRETMYLL